MSDLTPNPAGAIALSSGNPLERLRSLSGQPLVRRALPWLIGAGALGAVALTWSLLAPAPQRIL